MTAHDGGDGESELSGAVTRLGTSMSCLSEELTDLERATRKLETSAQALSDQQKQVSENLAATAAQLREQTPRPGTTASTRAVSADD